MKVHRLLPVICLTLSLVACARGSGGEMQQLGAEPGSSDHLVTVGFYDNDQCVLGTEAYTITFDVWEACFGWTRDGGARGTVENSASHFQCYTDRLCYTQYTNQLTCGEGFSEQKQASTTECIQEPNGNTWSKIINGTEACPAAPEGFSCP